VAGRCPRQGAIEFLALLNTPQNLRDQQRLFNAGNDSELAAAFRASLNVDEVN
jgi:hypothetical protein